MDAPDAGASPLQHLQHGEFQRELAHAISELPERERLVLSMYYERELNLREIGAVLKVSEKIGRASCRERVCQYVLISVVAVSLKKKQNQHQLVYIIITNH